MRKMLICAAMGAIVLTLADTAASGRNAGFAAQSFTAQHVDRTLKSDRAISVRQEALHSRGRHAPRPSGSVIQRPKLLEGCELAVSPLSESAQLGMPARCIS